MLHSLACACLPWHVMMLHLTSLHAAASQCDEVRVTYCIMSMSMFTAACAADHSRKASPASARKGCDHEFCVT